jgi:hypothetical protein
MFRKTFLALTALLGAAAFAPTTASAHWHGGPGFHRHGFWAPRVMVYGGPAVYDPCLRRQWVATPFGMRLRWVNVCVY